MLTKPFNEHILWKGAIQKANYPKPITKPTMILPQINWLTGHPIPHNPSISQQMLINYESYSNTYWKGVRERAEAYRNKNRSPQ